jgi:hemerythrin superfamily protein
MPRAKAALLTDQVRSTQCLWVDTDNGLRSPGAFRCSPRQLACADPKSGIQFMATSQRSTKATAGRYRDAVTLLKADHQQVKQWFAQFKKAGDQTRQGMLARNICNALRLHTSIEEEIFYPAFLEATKDEDIHHEAEVEHQAAERLIVEIEQSTPADDFFRAKVNVLGEMIKHHVREEEKPGGMFAKARKAKMDLRALGQQLAERKSELESEQQAA